MRFNAFPNGIQKRISFNQGENRMIRKLSIALTVLLAFGMAAQTFAAGTPAGTVITNRAYGGYSDANGNVIADVDNPATRIQSDLVSTTVSQVYGVDVEATQALDLSKNQSVTYALTVENTGNGADTFDLSQITTGSGHTVTLYEDTDGDGGHDAGEPVTSGTGSIAADAVYRLVAVVADANGTQGEQYVTTVTATSQGSGSVTDNSVLTSTVQAALMTASLAPDATVKDPGDVITYTVNYGNSNDANSETAYGVSVALPVPANCTWVGNVTLNGTPTGSGSPVSVGNVAAGGSGTITYQVQVNAGTPSGTTIDNQVSVDYNDGASQPYTQVVAYANAGTGGRVTVNEVNGFSTDIAPASQSGDPGDVVRYLVTVNNTGNGSDSFALSNESSTQSWTWTFYIDTNDNGVFDAGVDVAGTNTGSIAQGASQGMWAVATIPAGTADAAVDASVFRATSDDNSATSDETGTTTVTAPVLSLDKEVSPTGDQPPGTTLTYTVEITNSGSGDATSVIIKDAIPSNTSYVAGSMLIGSTSQTDASDSPTDESECNGTTAVFGVGGVANGASVTVQFQVTID
jgi:large repetitive protein